MVLKRSHGVVGICFKERESRRRQEWPSLLAFCVYLIYYRKSNSEFLYLCMCVFTLLACLPAI